VDDDGWLGSRILSGERQSASPWAMGEVRGRGIFCCSFALFFSTRIIYALFFPSHFFISMQTADSTCEPSSFVCIYMTVFVVSFSLFAAGTITVLMRGAVSHLGPF
jgi:hypothetical protein